MGDVSRSRRVFDYGIAVAAVVAATLLRFAVDPLLGDTAQFITFFVAIVLVGAVGGQGPAFAATVLSTLSVVYFFIPPAWAFFPIAPGHGMSVIMFVIAAGCIAWIAGRMHAARRKARSEADRATGILDSMGDGYLALDRQWTITAVNSAAQQMLQMHCPGMVGRSLWDCFPEAVGSRFEREYKRVLQERAPAHFEEFFPPLGTWFDVSAYPTDEGLALFFRDITRRKQAEQTLHEQREWLRVTLSSIGDAVLATDTDSRVTFLNPVGAALIGWGQEEAVGKPVSDVFPVVNEVTRQPADDVVTRVLRDRQIVALANHTALITRDGREVPIEDSAAPILDTDGNVTGVVLVFHDVSAKRRAQEELQRAKEDLELRVAERTAELREAHRSLLEKSRHLEERAGQLRLLSSQLIQAEQRERQRVAHILHEHFQQLLAGAKFDLSLLQSQLCGRDTCKAPPVLERVQQILNQSIAESRSLSVELSPPILHAAGLADALHWLGDWMREKHGLEVEVQADEAADPAAEDIRVLLFHAVRELLYNVVKHARTRRASVKMASGPGGKIQVVVSDDGIGFAADRLRVNGTSRSGFGIFSLSERLGLLGGQLRIDSRPGAGTRMTLELPVLISHAAGPGEAPAGVATAARPCPADRGSATVGEIAAKIRVLLADDHIVVRDGLCRLLQLQSDMQVIGQAADGHQAVDLARQLRPDVVLMDVSMPGLSGVEASRQILAEQPAVRVIGLSMHADEGVATSMMEAGAINYLSKTARPDSVIAAIRAAVCGHRR